MTRRGLALLAAALVLATAARASPLGKDGCAQLKVEQEDLERAGTRASMSKGPQWAKSNLEPARLEQIKRLLEIDEQLLFRCGGRSLVNLPKDPDPDPAAREPGDSAAKAPAVAKAPKKDPAKKAAAAPSDKPAKKKAAAPKGTPAPAAASKGETETAKKDAQKTAAAKKAKAKAKEPAAGATPFGSQQ